ncbi:MAG: hypothetical protein OHK0045_20110 [Raineya sp.]
MTIHVENANRIKKLFIPKYFGKLLLNIDNIFGISPNIFVQKRIDILQISENKFIIQIKF